MSNPKKVKKKKNVKPSKSTALKMLTKSTGDLKSLGLITREEQVVLFGIYQNAIDKYIKTYF